MAAGWSDEPGWLVGRTDDFFCEHEPPCMCRFDAMTDLLRARGLDPADFMLTVAITCRSTAGGEQVYRLHLTRYVRDDQGRLTFDVAADQVVTQPVVIEVPYGSWPSWLTGMGVPVSRAVA